MLEGIISGEVKKPGILFKNELQFKNYLEFPAIGKPDILYIATDGKNKGTYFFIDGHYQCTGRDWQEIEEIQATL